MTGAIERVLPLVIGVVLAVLITGVERAAAEEAPRTESVQTEAAQEAAQALPAIKKEELFRKIFGEQSSDGVQTVVSPILIDGENWGQIIVLLPRANAPWRVQAGPLLAKLQDLLDPFIHDRLTSMVDPEGNLSVDVLISAGLTASFDEKKLELHVEIPAELRKTLVTPLRGRGEPPGLENALAPNPFSTYLNLRVGEDYIHRAQEQANVGRQPLNSNLAGAVNVKGWVLEGDAGYTESADDLWTRGDVRLIVDDPQRMLRYSAGDLSVPIKGYLRGTKMGGITVARNFSLQPYRVTEPISQYEFFLNSPSTVEVWVNDGIVRTLQLPAGRHDLRDLPLSVGFSEVRLRIIDDVGREKTLTFDAISESELLAPGLHQFAYSFGFPWIQDGGMRSYDWTRPTLSLFHRLGLSSTLTLGAFLEGDLDQQLAGAEGLWANFLGLWGLEGAVSDVTDISKSYAARLRYRGRGMRATGMGERTWGANIEVVGPHFGTFGEGTDSANPYWLDVSASYGQRLFWGIYGGLSGSYRFARRMQTVDRYAVSLAVGSALGRGFHANLNLSQRSTTEGEQDQSAFLSLTWAIPGTQQHVSSSHDTLTETSRGAWRYLSPRSVDSLNASVAVEHTPRDSGVTGSLDYAGYRAKALFSHAAVAPAGQFADTELRSSLRLGTAVVFAGGYLALSSPVSDSFALVVPNEQLEQVGGQTIRINPSQDYDAARVDWLGSGVMPALHSYHLSTLHIEAPELPFGYELGQTKYDLRPTYKSGFLIKVGTDATVFLRGVLLDVDGSPVVLQAGTIISRDDPKWEPVIMFTNRKGKFAVEGMKPGQYDLNMFKYAEAGIPIEIPEGTAGIYDVGSVEIVPTGKGPSALEATPAAVEAMPAAMEAMPTAVEAIVKQAPEGAEALGVASAAPPPAVVVRVPNICETYESGAKIFTAYFEAANFQIKQEQVGVCGPSAFERLKKCAGGVLKLVGYADHVPYTSKGKDLNLWLSKSRAKRVAEYLRKMLPSSSDGEQRGMHTLEFEFELRAIGKGSVPPDPELAPEEARQRNRRVDVLIERCK